MEETISRLSYKLGLSKDMVAKIYKAYWQYIKTTIEDMPFERDLTPEEFDSLRVNFNITGLGKLTCSYDKYVLFSQRKKKRDAKYKKD